MRSLRRLAVLSTSMLALSLSVAAARADMFIGFGAPADKGWVFETFPAASRATNGSKAIGTFNLLAYFGDGFTGTDRDRMEYWIAGAVGYADAAGDGRPGRWGFASPQLGIEYYYNVIQPDKRPGGSQFTWWTTPTFTVSFPNGNNRSYGYGGGANQYTVGFNVNNYFQNGNYAATVNPLQLFYSFENQDATDLGNGVKRHLKGGLSLTLFDVAAGYDVLDGGGLFVGVHHAYSINNIADSDFKSSRRGKIGPTVAYFGWAKQGWYVAANLNFDYYVKNQPRQTELTMAITKHF